MPGFVLIPEVGKQSVVTHEGVVRAGDVVSGFYEYDIGRHVGVFGELIEAQFDVGFEGRFGKSVDVVAVGYSVHLRGTSCGLFI